LHKEHKSKFAFEFVKICAICGGKNVLSHRQWRAAKLSSRFSKKRRRHLFCPPLFATFGRKSRKTTAMFEFHQDKETYFDYQYRTGRDFLLPFVLEKSSLPPQAKILEIGCGEAGVLKAFLEAGHTCVGIELQAHRVELAKVFHAEALAKGQIQFVTRNIYDIDPEKELSFKFDLIILKDVIEHIPDQERFMGFLKAFLAPGGKVFFAFPPWYMPFGGHQQICKNKWLSRLPYYHILPKPLYRWLLQTGGEPADRVQELLEIKDTGISIERFERILRQKGYSVLLRRIYLLNPIYFFKFGLKPRIQTPLISVIPYLRDFISTAVYYLIEPK